MNWPKCNQLIKAILEKWNSASIINLIKDSQASPYIMLRWISFDERNLEEISKCSNFALSNLKTNEEVLQYCYHSISPKKYKFIKYLKQPPKKKA